VASPATDLDTTGRRLILRRRGSAVRKVLLRRLFLKIILARMIATGAKQFTAAS
jgi:hypothetical protein